MYVLYFSVQSLDQLKQIYLIIDPLDKYLISFFFHLFPCLGTNLF